MFYKLFLTETIPELSKKKKKKIHFQNSLSLTEIFPQFLKNCKKKNQHTKYMQK